MESQLTRLESITEVVAVVQAVEGAKLRKDIPLRPGVTFFSKQDYWLYQEIQDERICQVCRANADIGVFNGLHLRARFPYLVILDENMIGGLESGGGGLAHPNCRCFLIRQIIPMEA